MSRSVLVVILIALAAILFVISRYLTFNTAEFESIVNPKVADSSEFASWVTFTPDTEKFTARFPREPEHVSLAAQNEVEKVLKHYNVYAAEGIDNTAYIIQDITFPKGPNPELDDKILDTTLAEIVASSHGGVLQESEITIFNDHEAKKFKIKSGDKHVLGIIFVADKNLYVISSVEKSKHPLKEEDEFNYFMNSFKIRVPSAKEMKDLEQEKIAPLTQEQPSQGNL